MSATGIGSMTLAFNHSASKGTTRLVLIALASHDGSGGIWPSIETLTRYTGMSRNTIKNAIRELVEIGELRVHLNAGGTHNTRPDQRPNLYEVMIVCPDDCDRSSRHNLIPNGGQPTGPRESNGGQPAGATGASPLANGGQPAGPEQPKNNPREQPLSSDEPDNGEQEVDLLGAPVVDASSEKSSIEEEFEVWWASFPSRLPSTKDRKPSFEKYRQARRRASAEDLLAGLERAKRVTWEGRDGPQIPMPQTWLNQERWIGELEASEAEVIGARRILVRVNTAPPKEIWLTQEPDGRGRDDFDNLWSFIGGEWVL